MNSRLAGYTKHRLKRSSFVHESKNLDRKYVTELTIPTTPISSADILDPLTHDLSAIDLRVDVPQLESGKLEDESIRKSLTLAMIQEDYPPDQWTHVYTDGSATRAIKDGGAGILAVFPSGRRETCQMATGKHCSNYRAETEALMKAVSLIIDSQEEVSSVVFLTDARSVLEALQNNKSPDLAKVLNHLSTTIKVALQWIPAHCGEPGNEKADQLASEGAKAEQPDVPVTYKEKVTIIKSLNKPNHTPDAYHKLNRAEQVTMVRLRSGHNRLNSHMFKKYRLVQSPKCPCGVEDQTVEHVLQRCKRHDQERAAMWPQDTTLERKLYGDVDDLRRTTAFIADTGVIV